MNNFNLKSERERLRKVMICSVVESGILDFGKAEVIMDKCFEGIEKQDKKFIESLRADISKLNYKMGHDGFISESDCYSILNKHVGDC